MKHAATTPAERKSVLERIRAKPTDGTGPARR
jgi:hypothetical protein